MQRVSRAAVRVDGETVAEVATGFLVLLGVSVDDGPEDAARLARKVAKLRVFEDDAGKMNLSISQVGGACLVVSQFTLQGDVKDGNRPSFTGAARPEVAEPLYEQFVSELITAGVPAQRGVFGAMMEVELVNDGPTTIWLDTVELFG